MGDLNSNLTLLLNSKKQRTDYLIEFAASSHYFTNIAEQLSQLPLDIRIKWWSSPAFYEPALFTRDPAAQPSAKLVLSPRYGINCLLHCWLHELVHLQQDMLGLMPEIFPDSTPKAPLQLLNAQADIQRYLFCEALAATKAIIASVEMRNHGNDRAWRGALAMREFRPLAEKASSLFDTQASGEDIATKTLLSWYELPIRQTYEKRALLAWKRHYERATSGSATNVIIKVSHVQITSFIELSAQILPPLNKKEISEQLSGTEAFMNPAVRSAVESLLLKTGKGATIPLSNIGNHSLIFQNQHKKKPA